MTEWLTRAEAAAYLKVSVRQLGRLPLPRSLLGSSPRFSKSQLDQYLEKLESVPGARLKRLAPVPLTIRGRKAAPTTTADVMSAIRG